MERILNNEVEVCVDRARWFLPQPLAAGGGDVVVYAASVDGCLDFSLAALFGGQRGDFGVNIGDFPFHSSTAAHKETICHGSTCLWGALKILISPFFTEFIYHP